MWPFSGIALRQQIRNERLRETLADQIGKTKLAQQIQSTVESLPVWAKDSDESQWSSYSTGERTPFNFTEQDIYDMQVKALNLSQRPGARVIIATLENFVIGQESNIVAADENPKVQAYWAEWMEQSDWDMRDKESFRRYIRDGETFNRFFSPKSLIPKEDAEFHHLITRFVSPLEIRDKSGNNTFGIKVDPDDLETVIEYYRWWTTPRPLQVENTEVILPLEPDGSGMVHFKIGVDRSVKRGLTHLIGAAEYITKYENWLDDRIKLNRIRSLYGLFGKATNPATDLSTVADKVNQDTTGKTKSGDGTLKKALEKPSILLTKGIEWEMKSLNLNARDTAEDGRRIQLYTGTAVQLAEYVISGDASNSNFASTMVSESPMVKAFEAQRDLHNRFGNMISRMVIGYGIKTGQLPAKSTKTITKEGAESMREVVRECKNVLDDQEKGLCEKVIEAITQKSETIPTMRTVLRSYPPLIHRDILKETQAVSLQVAGELLSRQTASEKLGNDWEQEQARMEEDTTEPDPAEEGF